MPTVSRFSSRAKRRPPESPAGLSTLRPLVDWLTDIGVTDHWVISCYLKLEPRDRGRGKYAIKLKNRIRERLAWLEMTRVSRAERDVVERDLTRIREYLEDPGNLPVGRGIAVFACETLELFEPVALPQVFRSRLAIDRSPLVRELAALDDEFGLVLCAAYDRHSARFFQVSVLGVEELPSLAALDATRPGKFHGARVGWGEKGGVHGTAMTPGEHNYHQRIREEKHRHYARIAERLFQLGRANGNVRGIVLAGTGNDAGAVEPHLHPYVAQNLLGTANLNPKSVTAAEVMDAVLEVRRESERAWEIRHVKALEEGRGTGWAVNGVGAALVALGRGQVRTLLVNPTAEAAGFRCAASGRLTIGGGDCDGEGGAIPIPDVIDEAIEDALRQGALVDVVEDPEVKDQVAGLAALLRFPVRPA